MSDSTSPPAKSEVPTSEATAPADRAWFRRVALAPLWIASVLLLSLAAAGTGAYLFARKPQVIETITPAAPAEVPAEVARRADALRAYNRSLEDQLVELRRQLQQPPQCPPGTSLEHGAAGKSPAELLPSDSSSSRSASTPHSGPPHRLLAP